MSYRDCNCGVSNCSISRSSLSIASISFFLSSSEFDPLRRAASKQVAVTFRVRRQVRSGTTDRNAGKVSGQAARREAIHYEAANEKDKKNYLHKNEHLAESVSFPPIGISISTLH